MVRETAPNTLFAVYSNLQKYLHMLLTRSPKNDETRQSLIGTPARTSKCYYILKTR